MKLRPFFFWTHLILGIATGLLAVLMAGTAVIMGFADTYLDIREHSLRTFVKPEHPVSASLDSIVARLNSAHPDKPVVRLGLESDPDEAIEVFYAGQGLAYADPYSGDFRETDVEPLRRTLHKGVEQWHRYLGLGGKQRETGQAVSAWSNAILVPLILTGLVLWWPRRLKWSAFRVALSPTSAGAKGRGTYRSWHTALGFWTAPLLLLMVVTATDHSFKWLSGLARSQQHPQTDKPDGKDKLWPPDVAPFTPTEKGAATISIDQLRSIADRELPGWTHLDLVPVAAPDKSGKVRAAKIIAKAPGPGPSFFPITLQVNPFSGEVVDRHSWTDLNSGTRVAVWVRWSHKGDAWGRPGQIVAALASLVLVILVISGWVLAIRRLLNRRDRTRAPAA